MTKITLRTAASPYWLTASSLLLMGGAALLMSGPAQGHGNDAAPASRSADAKNRSAATPMAAAPTTSVTARPQAQDVRSAHAIAGQKSNGSGVRFTADAPKSMAPGQTSRVTLQFAATETTQATASVRMPDGMVATLVDGSPLTAIALNATQPTTVELWVTARDDGTQYFDVSTTRDGRTSVQSVALKVGSGAVKLKSNGTIVTTPGGEKIVSMPAQ